MNQTIGVTKQVCHCIDCSILSAFMLFDYSILSDFMLLQVFFFMSRFALSLIVLCFLACFECIAIKNNISAQILNIIF